MVSHHDQELGHRDGNSDDYYQRHGPYRRRKHAFDADIIVVVPAIDEKRPGAPNNQTDEHRAGQVGCHRHRVGVIYSADIILDPARQPPIPILTHD